MFATDTLSRYPVGCADPEDIELNNEVEIASINVASTCVNDYLSVTLVDIRNASYNDEAYQLLVQNKSFASKMIDEHPLCKPFYNIRNRLSIVDDLLMYSFEGEDMRLVIPSTLQAKVTKNLHSAHQGSDAILKRARRCVYWPGMGRDIVQSCASCKICATKCSITDEGKTFTIPYTSIPFSTCSC